MTQSFVFSPLLIYSIVCTTVYNTHLLYNEDEEIREFALCGLTVDTVTKRFSCVHSVS